MESNITDQEREDLKVFCAALRESQTLSDPIREEEGQVVCNVIPDPVAAQAAEIIEELVRIVTNLEYELSEVKSV